MAKSLNEFLKEPTVYSEYKLNIGERMLAFAVGFVAGVIVMHIFFGIIIVDIIVGVGAGIGAQVIFRNFLKNMRLNKLLLQFKDMLDSLNTSYSVGKTTQAAFSEAYDDLVLQYGEDSYICLELAKIKIGLTNVSTIEELVGDFAQRSGLDDIMTFADVFYAVNRRGGNIKSIIGETKSIICDKIEIEQEIKTITSSSKNSLYIIICMPLIIVPMMSGFSDGGDTVVDIVTKIGAIILFAIAFFVGMKISDIKV